MFVPPVSLIGSVGGSRVPKRRWVTIVGMCTPVAVVPATAAVAAVSNVCVCAPLLLGGIYVLRGCPGSDSSSSMMSSS